MRSNNVSEPFGAILWRRVRLFTCRSDYGEFRLAPETVKKGYYYRSLIGCDSSMAQLSSALNNI
jgi:hypothetical protein